MAESAFYTDDRSRTALPRVRRRSSRSSGPTFACTATSHPRRACGDEREAYAALLGSCRDAARTPLAELVNPLVITDDGTLKPIAYDFDPRFDVAALGGL